MLVELRLFQELRRAEVAVEWFLASLCSFENLHEFWSEFLNPQSALTAWDK